MNEQANKNSSEFSIPSTESKNAEQINNSEVSVEEQHDVSEIDIERYPLRKASDDPRWAVWVVWIWVGIALFLLLFITILFILGLWFD